MYTWTLGASHTPAAFFLTAGQALALTTSPTRSPAFCSGLLSALSWRACSVALGARMDGGMEARSPAGSDNGGGDRARGSGLLCGRLSLPGARGASSADTNLDVVDADRASRRVACLELRRSGAQPCPYRVLWRGCSWRGLPRRAPRTATVALARPRDSAAASCTPRGRRSDSRQPGAIRSRSARAGHSVLDALRGQASTLEGAGDYERTILALHACGLPASAFGGASLLDRLLRERSSDGSFEHLVNITAFAIFALRVAGSSADDPGRELARRHWLAAQQNSDGGFGFAGRGGSERRGRHGGGAAGRCRRRPGSWRSALAARAVAYLRRAQNPDGGFPQQPGGESNAQSTAWAVQGLARGRRKRGCGHNAAVAARRSATWRAWSPPTGACATRAPARRRPCG